MRKKIILAVLAVIVVLSGLMAYWFYFSKPAKFPTNEQLMKQMNEVFPAAAAETIQDTVTIDERHKVVPFITKENRYGISYWVWSKHKWKSVYIDDSGEPRLWKINRKDASSYHLVWNIHPNDGVSTVKFYLMKDRNYLFQGGEHFYFPKIQLEQAVSLENKSYGVMGLPKDWVTVVDSLGKIEAARRADLWFQSLFPARDLFFGWLPLNGENEETFPENSVNGQSYSDGDEIIDFVPFVNKSELE
ncbi:hypothetical protein [Bacillus sp. FJAT-29814]|uniref:hypothetical protein n=1 Tax=Bacillus sp. FJAT-29814 TaxID=1729688 RepID=UPI00082A27A7|nr:hypothetical protein [Bacillus sp. FJAT-29814]